MYKFVLLFIFVQFLCTFVTCHSGHKPYVTPVASNKLQYAYCPFWDVKTQTLRLVDYIDTQDQIFYSYSPAQNRLYSAQLDTGRISAAFAIPMAGNINEIAVGDAFAKTVFVATWDGVSPVVTTKRNVTSIEPNIPTNTVDIASVDPKGRLVVGTYRRRNCIDNGEPNAAVYIIEKNGQILPIINNIKTIQGITWNKRKRLLYFFDSCTYTIYEFKWSPKTGMATHPRLVITFPATKDYVILGMDIDCRGHLFVGTYLSPYIFDINPKTGQIEDYILLPVDTITGVAFGGKNMETLFVVTSATIYFNYYNPGDPVTTFSNNTQAGQIFMVKGLNTKGCPYKRIRSPL